MTADNIVDNAEHCLREQTSPHLAEELSGNRDFLTGTIADVLADRVTPAHRRAAIFSPFGLGALDIAVGQYVYERARAEGKVVEVQDFFAGLS